MDKKTGGPAFPCPQDSINQNAPSLGMTLRDYFAASFLANKWCAHDTPQKTAAQAYKIADAMLEARET